MKATIYKTNAVISGTNDNGLNLKYHVLNRSTFKGTGVIVYRFYDYAHINGVAPEIDVVVYNGDLGVTPDYTTADITLKDTIVDGDNTIKVYSVSFGNGMTYGYYRLSYTQYATKIMVEAVDHCTCGFIEDNALNQYVYINKDNLLGHFNYNIVDITGIIGSGEGSYLYFRGAPVYNPIMSHVNYFYEKADISELFNAFHYANGAYLTGAGVYGNFEDLADHINISSYKSRNGNYYSGRYLLQYNNLHGDFNNFVTRLVSRGARNYAATFFLVNNNIENIPYNGEFMLLIDANGDTSTTNDVNEIIATLETVS